MNDRSIWLVAAAVFVILAVITWLRPVDDGIEWRDANMRRWQEAQRWGL